MGDLEKVYQEKIQRITTAASHQEPDIVPVIHNAETWCISYAGYKVADIQNNIQKEYECFGKMYTDIYADGTLFGALSRDLNIYNSLGGGAYFYSRDGVTIQHKEYVFMRDDEYAKLAEDPMGFTINEIYPRKYPALNKSYPENLHALKDSLNAYTGYIKKMIGSGHYAKEQHGMPSLIGGIGQAPFDIIMDFYRGFTGIMGDVRRRPEDIKEAAEALVPLVLASIKQGKPTIAPFPYTFFPLHAPAFLSPKQFGDLYWPSFKKVLEQVNALGGKALIILEGNWEHLYDYVNEIPKDFAIACIENDDIFQAKEQIGKTVTIYGGMSLSMLRNASKRECLDHAKKVIDKCAPGGGFLFSLDKALLAPGDVNVENLVAVYEFVHTYGKY
jgi:hypothetical protein